MKHAALWLSHPLLNSSIWRRMSLPEVFCVFMSFTISLHKRDFCYAGSQFLIRV